MPAAEPSRLCETSGFASPPRGGFALTAIVPALFRPPVAGFLGRAAGTGQVGEGVDERLGERRERLDRVAQYVDRHLGPDRERGLSQPLAGLRSDRVGAG